MAKGLPRLDGKDEHAYGHWEARVNVIFNKSASSIYIIPTGQEKYNSAVRSSLVPVAAQQQDQPLLCSLHVYEWGSHYSSGTTSRMGESIQQWYDVTRAGNWTRGLE